MITWRWALLALPVPIIAASPVAAQVADGLIVSSRIPQNYNRGRNVSVDEQPRPDFTPNGVRFGALLLYPRVETAAGGTSNAYLRRVDIVGAPFVSITPSARLVSDWSRHLLQVSGSATLRDYLGESPRNERLWIVEARGRLDVRRTVQVQAEARASKAVENLFSGEITPTLGALSRYRRDSVSTQATYTSGRGRAFILVDYTDLRFEPIPLLTGGNRDQSDRDRGIARLTAQVEYARSPSVSLFGQLSGDRTRFDRGPIGGGQNLDSKAARLLVGANVDVAGRVRGTIGVGYLIRDYDATLYRTVDGVSVDTEIQLFPLRRLTITAEGERSISSATINRLPAAYWNTRFSLRGDYELLRNLILNASGGYSSQRYIDNRLKSDVKNVSVGARYLASRRISLRGALRYSTRQSNNRESFAGAKESRAEIGIGYQL